MAENAQEKNKGGRPKFKIDYALVDSLAGIHCTQQEIADILGCSVDTLQRDKKFCGIYKSKIATAKMSLRRKQWESVEEGNTTMLIWLGKQYLSQKEPRDQSGDDNELPPPTRVVFEVKQAVGEVKVTNAAK